MLERNRNVDHAIAPDTGALPTLAEEMSAWRTQHPRKTGNLQQNPRPTTAKRVVRILYFEMLNVWMDFTVRECESNYYNYGSRF